MKEEKANVVILKSENLDALEAEAGDYFEKGFAPSGGVAVLLELGARPWYTLVMTKPF